MSFHTYTTVSMKDALEAKVRGQPGADFLMTCANTPVYSVPASVFFGFTETAAAPAASKVVTGNTESTSVSVTITTTPAEIPPVKKEVVIPTLAEFNALPKDKKGHWECLHCCAPALVDAYMPGSYCSSNCAYWGYL
jgi:hypothetical protein